MLLVQISPSGAVGIQAGPLPKARSEGVHKHAALLSREFAAGQAAFVSQSRGAWPVGISSLPGRYICSQPGMRRARLGWWG